MVGCLVTLYWVAAAAAAPTPPEGCPSADAVAVEIERLGTASAVAAQGTPEVRVSGTRLRVEALLEAYERRYPTGHMRIEARALRAEIYLAQGRDDAALAVLDVISLSGLPRARELETVRGELRVKAGRCREARADLGSVLEAGTTDGLARRATRALAHCP